MQNNISAIFFDFDSKEGWKVLGESFSARWVVHGESFSGGVKLPEGISSTEETTFETLRRKAKEMGIEILECYYVHSNLCLFSVPSRKTRYFYMMKRYFYLVKRFAGSFPFNEEKKVINGEDEVRIQWYGLEEFETAIYKIPDYKEGYIKAFLKMAEHNEKFRRDNEALFQRYSTVKLSE